MELNCQRDYFQTFWLMLHIQWAGLSLLKYHFLVDNGTNTIGNENTQILTLGLIMFLSRFVTLAKLYQLSINEYSCMRHCKTGNIYIIYHNVYDIRGKAQDLMSLDLSWDSNTSFISFKIYDFLSYPISIILISVYLK